MEYYANLKGQRIEVGFEVSCRAANEEILLIKPYTERPYKQAFCKLFVGSVVIKSIYSDVFKMQRTLTICVVDNPP